MVKCYGLKAMKGENNILFVELINMNRNLLQYRGIPSPKCMFVSNNEMIAQ